MQAAKKAERKGEWHKALEEWKAAYSADVNAEYLIGIGDAYSHMGNKDEAKKNYEAYLADPLALPANVEKVKSKIASLEAPAGGLALPGGPGLALPGADAPPPLPGLDLPAPVAAEAKGKKGKKGKGGDAAPPPLPGLDLPGAPPAQTAKAEPPPLPGLELPGMAPAPSKKEEKKIASASPGLELPGLPLPGAPPAKAEAAPPPPKKETAVASTPKKTGGQQVAMTSPPPPPERKRVPEAAIVESPRGQQAEASGASRTVAYVAAGVAVVALGGGAFAFTKAGSAHTELTSKIHDGATAQGLLEDEAKNKTLSFVGFAAGLVSAGIATALFAF
ncbi:MAG: hypothetical protein ACXWJ3_19100 [Caldimonas sp.]